MVSCSEHNDDFHLVLGCSVFAFLSLRFCECGRLLAVGIRDSTFLTVVHRQVIVGSAFCMLLFFCFLLTLTQGLVELV